MHYHIDLITHATALVESFRDTGGTSQYYVGRSPPFGKIQTDRAGLEPGRPTTQTEMLTIMLSPRPLIPWC